MNTPEARLQRQQEELQEQKFDVEFQQVAAQGERLFHSELLPAITQISDALPYVTPDELGAKLLLAMEPYRVHTRRGPIVPPRAYDAVRQMVLNEVVPWAKDLQDARTARFGTVTADAKNKVAVAEAKAEKATVESQKSKNLATRTTRPVGRSQKEVAPKKPIVSVQDGMEDSVASALAAMGFDRS